MGWAVAVFYDVERTGPRLASGPVLVTARAIRMRRSTPSPFFMLRGVRLSTRYNIAQLKRGGFPVSLRITTNFPVVDFPIEAEIIPVGEGRFDYESGLSLYPAARLHVLGLGYRYRTLNQETTRQPRNEVSFLPEIGGTSLFGGAGGKLVFDWVFG